MSTTDPTTLTPFQSVQNYVQSEVWIENLKRLENTSPEPLKAWMQRVDENQVDVLQLTLKDGQVARVWTPGPRQLDAHSHATYATLDGSRRDYSGVQAIHATAHAWFGYDKSMSTAIIYRVA